MTERAVEGGDLILPPSLDQWVWSQVDWNQNLILSGEGLEQTLFQEHLHICKSSDPTSEFFLRTASMGWISCLSVARLPPGVFRWGWRWHWANLICKDSQVVSLLHCCSSCCTNMQQKSQTSSGVIQEHVYLEPLQQCLWSSEESSEHLSEEWMWYSNGVMNTCRAISPAVPNTFFSGATVSLLRVSSVCLCSALCSALEMTRMCRILCPEPPDILPAT